MRFLEVDFPIVLKFIEFIQGQSGETPRLENQPEVMPLWSDFRYGF
jgi:hypothetical protein